MNQRPKKVFTPAYKICLILCILWGILAGEIFSSILASVGAAVVGAIILMGISIYIDDFYLKKR